MINKVCGILAAVCLLGGCAGTSYEFDPGTPDTPFAGSYEGTETLVGGTFPLTITISPRGEIRIVDVDGITARGLIDGDRFLVERGSPRQVFEGQISGNEITGKTYDNPYLGDGTFSLTRATE